MQNDWRYLQSFFIFTTITKVLEQMRISLKYKAALVVIAILLVDQISKFLIKTSMPLGATHSVLGDWFKIRFIENPGMAFGIDIPGRYGKPALTLFRIVAVVIIGMYLRRLIKSEAPAGFIICLAVILAGAIGNIIDSMFYGMIFTESTYFEAAKLFPGGKGYAPFLHGQVVDMLYFPLIDGRYPSWIPFRGGENFIFFRPIFNVADTAISVGVISILVFHRNFLRELS
jgi:signal peptidase II